MTEPIVSWYEGDNSESSEITDVVQYGTVDADSPSDQKKIFIWNNRNGNEDVSKMEEVTFTTRDRNGGTGDVVGNIVEAVRDSWFQVKVDSLAEYSFTPVGKGDGTTNPSGLKEIGTTGSTTNPNAATASEWATGVSYVEDDYVKPTTHNDFIYRVNVAGTTGSTEPTWSVVEGNTVTDGTVEYIAVKIEREPAAQELLGLKNSVLADGSNAEDGGGNFAELTVYAEVPITASAGKNLLMQRISYRYV